MEKKKVGFFKRLYMAIFKLEDYTSFFEDGAWKSFKYFVLLTLLVGVIFSVVGTISFNEQFKVGYSFFKTLPEFEYKDGSITKDVYAYGYNEKFSTFFIMDTSKNIAETKELEEEVKKYDKNYIDSDMKILIYEKQGYISYDNTITKLDYEKISNEIGIQKFSKKELVDNIEQIGTVGLLVVWYIYSVIGNFTSIFITFILDTIMLAIFAEILGFIICRIKIKFSEGFTIAAHAVTLPIIITLIYSIVNYFTGFYMEYFAYMTVIIEYVYIVAVIFMIKSDKQKMQEEMAKIENVRIEVKKELEENAKEDSEETEDLDETKEVKNNVNNEDDKKVSEEG